MSHAVIHAIGFPPVIFPMGAPQSWTTDEGDVDEDCDVPDPPKCENCGGGGGAACPDCKGTGVYVGATVREPCKRCKGSRRDACERCGGSGY